MLYFFYFFYPPLRKLSLLRQLHLRHRNKRLINLRVDRIRGTVTSGGDAANEHAWEFGALRVFHRRPAIVLRVLVDPLEDGDAQIGAVGVAALADVFVHQLRLAVHLVNLSQLGDDPAVGVHGEDGIVIGIGEQHWPRSHQGGDGRPVPLVRVVQEHAIAMAVDDLVLDVAFQVAHAADWDGTVDAVIGGGDPEGGCPAAGDAGDRDLVRSHVRPGDQIIDAANAVPAFAAGRAVAAAWPPTARSHLHAHLVLS